MKNAFLETVETKRWREGSRNVISSGEESVTDDSTGLLNMKQNSIEVWKPQNRSLFSRPRDDVRKLKKWRDKTRFRTDVRGSEERNRTLQVHAEAKGLHHHVEECPDEGYSDAKVHWKVGYINEKVVKNKLVWETKQVKLSMISEAAQKWQRWKDHRSAK